MKEVGHGSCGFKHSSEKFENKINFLISMTQFLGDIEHNTNVIMLPLKAVLRPLICSFIVSIDS